MHDPFDMTNITNQEHSQSDSATDTNAQLADYEQQPNQTSTKSVTWTAELVEDSKPAAQEIDQGPVSFPKEA